MTTDSQPHPPGADAAKRPHRVAVLLFDGVDDVAALGPSLVFRAANHVAGHHVFDVYTVTPSTLPIRSIAGVLMLGDATISNATDPEVLVLPGADGSRIPARDSATMRWIDDVARRATHIVTVSTGVGPLAQLGLASGLEATSHPNAVAVMQDAAPDARIHSDRLRVDNGTIVCASHLAGGIEAALRVVKGILGTELAQDAARFIEYTPVELDAQITRRAVRAPMGVRFN